jgi:peptidoglycan hydrolase-like protein with peptidoglycan-binding domain
MKQYRGGHDEVWGGVRINIDSNWLDLGKGSWAPPESHCDGTVSVDLRRYRAINPIEEAKPRDRVRVLQCLFKEAGAYGGKVTGVYNDKTVAAVRAWQEGHGFVASDTWSVENWMSLHAAGTRPVVKLGSAGGDVRDLQRALNSAMRPRLEVTGVFDRATDTALREYQYWIGFPVSGVAQPKTWQALRTGNRYPNR